MDAKASPRISIRMFLAILLNLAVFVQTFCSILTYFRPDRDGMGCFVYFTVDSNILAAVVSLILAVFEIKGMKTGKTAPKWAVILKFMGTVAVGVTFFTVMLFLGPTSEVGFGPLVTGHNLFLHVLNPLAAMFSLAVLERKPNLRLAETLWGLVPTILYGIVYFYKVMILGPGKGGWFDFYGFTLGGMWYLSAIALPLATWLIALGIWALRKAGKKTK